jgi:hypothetical protein
MTLFTPLITNLPKKLNKKIRRAPCPLVIFIPEKIYEGQEKLPGRSGVIPDSSAFRADSMRFYFSLFQCYSNKSLIEMIESRSGAETAKKMGWTTGFEPATTGTTIQGSIQLSYAHHNPIIMCKHNAPAPPYHHYIMKPAARFFQIFVLARFVSLGCIFARSTRPARGMERRNGG